MLKFSLAACICIFPAWGYAKPQTLILKAQPITQSQRQSLCTQLKISCEPDATWQLYQVPNDAKRHYLIAKLKLFELEKNAQRYHLRNDWDFSAYQPLSQTPHWTVDGSAEKRIYWTNTVILSAPMLYTSILCYFPLIKQITALP